MEHLESTETASLAETSPTSRGMPGSRASPITSVSRACSATPGSRVSPASPGSQPPSVTLSSRPSPATLVSPDSPATPGFQASPATPGSRPPPASPVSRPSPATLGSRTCLATLVSPDCPASSFSPASPASPVSRASTATPDSRISLAVQAPQTFPSSSLLYPHVSRIITSRKQRAGIWFPHLGLIEKTPESTTTAMMKQPFLPESRRKTEEHLPLCYQRREQQASKNNFPFSVHDNRRGLEFCGHGLDECLGRKKLEQVQLHFHSTNFNRWASGYVPRPEDNISTYQASYMGKPRVRGPFFPLFPKHHSDRWNAPFI